MAQITWTEPALINIEGIAEYIALSNPDAAANLVQVIFNAVQRLDEFPDSGRIPPELKRLDYRGLVVNPCRVFYKIQKQEIVILHVLRQERDIRRYILSASERLT